MDLEYEKSRLVVAGTCVIETYDLDYSTSPISFLPISSNTSSGVTFESVRWMMNSSYAIVGLASNEIAKIDTDSLTRLLVLDG